MKLSEVLDELDSLVLPVHMGIDLLQLLDAMGEEAVVDRLEGIRWSKIQEKSLASRVIGHLGCFISSKHSIIISCHLPAISLSIIDI